MNVVCLNTGMASYNNGARGPIKIAIDLAALLGGYVNWGFNGEWETSIGEIDDKDLPTVIEILEEQKMIYRVKRGDSAANWTDWIHGGKPRIEAITF